MCREGKCLSSAARRCVTPPATPSTRSALPRHPRVRAARRVAVGDVDPAGGRPARLGPVGRQGSSQAQSLRSPNGVSSMKRGSQASSPGGGLPGPGYRGASLDAPRFPAEGADFEDPRHQISGRFRVAGWSRLELLVGTPRLERSRFLPQSRHQRVATSYSKCRTSWDPWRE